MELVFGPPAPFYVLYFIFSLPCAGGPEYTPRETGGTVPQTPADLLVPFACLLGAFVGSFLNVCIYRLPRENLHIFRPAWSRCTFCLTTIRWYDNIPILSWLLLGRKCRDCRSPIAVLYPLIEALTAALFALVAWLVIHRHAELSLPWQQGVLFAVQAYLIGCLIVSTFIDLELRIIPDELTFIGMILAPIAGCAFPFLYPGRLPDHTSASVAGMLFSYCPSLYTFLSTHPHVQGLSEALLGMAVGGFSVWGVGFLGRIAFRKEAMGLGDVKYMAFLGGFLGWKGILVTFVLAAILGAVCGILAYLATRDRTMAFGPYLSIGALVMTLVPEDTVSLYLALMNGLVYWLTRPK